MHFLKLCFIFFVLDSTQASSSSEKRNRELQANDPCLKTQTTYQQKGFNNTAPSVAIEGNNLPVCSMDYTCCTREMEDDFKAESIQHFENKVLEESFLVKNVFDRKFRSFDDLFVELIDGAEASLDILFFRTYGDRYLDNSEVFKELFQQLKAHYKGGSVDMGDLFDNFFTSVLQKVFKLMHSNFSFDDDYMACIAENMAIVKPFANLPAKLPGQVHSAFVTARLFVKSLEAGQKLAGSVAKIYPTSECAKALMKMSHCSTCQGYAPIKPCHSFCMNVMKGCLVDYSELNLVWDQYIDAMQTALDHLSGPFNIERVLAPFDVKISEAIMIVQETKLNITSVIFRECGQPKSISNTPLEKLELLQESTSEDLYAPHLPPSYNDNHGTPLPTFGSFLQSESDDASLPGSEKSSSDDYVQSEEPPSPPTFATPYKRASHRKMSQRKYKSKRSRRRHSTLEQSRYEYNEETRAFEERRPHATETTDYSEVTEYSRLAFLVTKMRKALEKLRNHWNKLPSHICEEEADVKTSQACWNGKTEGHYPLAVIEGDDFNPEVVIASVMPGDVIRTQINSLKNTIEKLETIYDLTAGDDETIMFDYSGDDSGDGSGSEESNARDNLKPPCCGSQYLSLNIIALITSLVLTLRHLA